MIDIPLVLLRLSGLEGIFSIKWRSPKSALVGLLIVLPWVTGHWLVTA